jgi:hypothetical protein
MLQTYNKGSVCRFAIHCLQSRQSNRGTDAVFWWDGSIDFPLFKILAESDLEGDKDDILKHPLPLTKMSQAEAQFIVPDWGGGGIKVTMAYGCRIGLSGYISSTVCNFVLCAPSSFDKGTDHCSSIFISYTFLQ